MTAAQQNLAAALASLARVLRDDDEPELQACAYCGTLSDGRWCSPQCRRADAYDGQHESER